MNLCPMHGGRPGGERSQFRSPVGAGLRTRGVQGSDGESPPWPGVIGPGHPGHGNTKKTNEANPHAWLISLPDMILHRERWANGPTNEANSKARAVQVSMPGRCQTDFVRTFAGGLRLAG